MSLFSNGPEGIRNAIYRSYKKHYGLTIDGKIGSQDDSPHTTALFGALATRNQVSGLPYDESNVWFELAPFLRLDDRTSIEALSDYIVLRELPDEIEDARYSELETNVNTGTKKLLETRPSIMEAMISYRISFPWFQLLSDELIDEISTTFGKKSIKENYDTLVQILHDDHLNCWQRVEEFYTKKQRYLFQTRNAIISFELEDTSVQSYNIYAIEDMQQTKLNNAILMSGTINQGSLRVDCAFIDKEGTEYRLIDFVVEEDGGKKDVSGEYQAIERPVESIATFLRCCLDPDSV